MFRLEPGYETKRRAILCDLTIAAPQRERHLVRSHFLLSTGQNEKKQLLHIRCCVVHFTMTTNCEYRLKQYRARR